MADTNHEQSGATSERRAHRRSRPSYTSAEVNALRIANVLLHEELLYCLLSDGRVLSVPLRMSPVVSNAPLHTRYQWQISERGESLIWSRQEIEERLRLPAMLAFPGSEMLSSPTSS